MTNLKRKKAYSLFYILLVVTFITICITIISTAFLNISYQSKLSQTKKEIVLMQEQIGEAFPEAFRKGYKPMQNGSNVTFSSLDGYSFAFKTVGTTGAITMKDNAATVYWEESFSIAFNTVNEKTERYTFSSESGLEWILSYEVVYTAADHSTIEKITRTSTKISVK